ncbi:hypothetical protein BDK88_2048 [Natrinema hispanicum]|uniref:Matrixin n=1 Tax=Natrinema hispanicum TaxID=392421 RepID=A0A482YDJ1_9EURY|nr:hypothetical protein BDK88_2048 [Natrinema hispanicum]
MKLALVNRRAFLGTVGSTVSLGTLAYTTRGASDTLEIRVWLSEQATTYDGVAERIREYLTATLSLEYWTLAVSTGGTVSVSSEDAARLTSRGEWPMAVATGALGGRELEPGLRTSTCWSRTGAWKRHPPATAFHTSHRSVERDISLPSSRSKRLVDDGPRSISPNTMPAHTMHVLLHEIGHALGLGHKHGTAFVDGDTVVSDADAQQLCVGSCVRSRSLTLWDDDSRHERSAPST